MAGPMPNPADKATDFFMWIGHCVTAWAKFEEHLFNIFLLSLKARRDHAAIIYYRTPGLEVRMGLVYEIVCTVLPKPEKKDGGHPHPDAKEWSDLRNAVSNLLAVRRRIAHHPARATSKIDEKDDVLIESTWVEIYMNVNETLRGKDPTPLKVEDLAKHCADIQEVTRRAARFERGVLPKHVG